MTIYPSFEFCVKVHDNFIGRFGGAPGIRDVGGIKSALARPRTGYYADLIDEAAAMIESLSQNHPFIDGNKRTAIAVGMTFLLANGYDLAFDDHEAYGFFIGLYQRRAFNFGNLRKWLRAHASAR